MRRLFAVIFLLACCSVHAVVPGDLTEDDYMNGYFSLYKSYITGNDSSKDELVDVIDYYLSTEDLGEDLYHVGPRSGKMIGSILADSGVAFDCGECDLSALGDRCCIYRVGGEPMAYDCMGSEVVGVDTYSWQQIWQCTYGCCKDGCCRYKGDTTTSTPASSTSRVSTTTSQTTSSTISGWGRICVDCCLAGESICSISCDGGPVRSDGAPISECSYDGSSVRIERGTSTQELSCLNGRCTGSSPSTTRPASTTTVEVSTSTSRPTSTIATTSSIASSTSTTFVEGPRITILFLPVDWMGSTAAFNSVVDHQMDFLMEHIPLKDCPQKVKAVRINASCTANIHPDWDTCYAEAGRILNTIASCARATGQKYDYVVGLSSDSLCAGRGFTSQTAPYIYLAGDEPRKTAHEMGHQWGLGDEYYDTCRCFSSQFPNYDKNCLDSSLGGADALSGYTSEYCAQGSMCPSKIGTATCFGNKNPLNTRCIMGTDYLGTDRDFCVHCKAHLESLSLLKC